MLIVALTLGVAALTPSSTHGQLPVAARAATVSGFVYDSISGKPLAGAIIRLASRGDGSGGRQFAASSDTLGNYVIAQGPLGRYDVGFFHVPLDSLGIAAATRETNVVTDSLRLDLATPSVRTLIGALCGPNAEASRSALLLGHVRAAASEQFLAKASVTVTWAEWRSGSGVVQQDIHSAVVETLENGWYAVCRLPSDVSLHVRAAHGADSSGFVQFVPGDSVRHLSLFVGELGRVALLSGTARDSTGKPVPNAAVTVLESGREARSNSLGVFVLDSLPAGTHMLEVMALGFVPVTMIVHLAPERRVVADVVLSRRPTELAPVTVIAQYNRNLAMFERHRTRSVGGHFLTAEEIARQPETSVGGLVRGLPGVTVRYIPREGYQVRMRRAATDFMRGIEECTPTIYMMAGGVSSAWNSWKA